MNLCKISTAKSFSFLVIDATLASDNPLRFRCNLLERKIIMTIDDKIRDQKLQHNINREPTKKSEYLIGEEILPPDQSRIVEQAKLTYSRLVKNLEEQRKNN